MQGPSGGCGDCIFIEFRFEANRLLKKGCDIEDFGLVQRAISEGADVNACRTVEGYSYAPALRVAVRKGNKEIVGLLLDHNANVNTKAYTTSFAEAVFRNNKEMVELLLARGADASFNGLRHPLGKPGIFAGLEDTSVLHMAVFNGNQEMVKLLLGQGADINFKVNRGTPLHIAVEKRDREMVKLLLAYSANATIKNACGDTPRDIARQKEDGMYSLFVDSEGE